jgi:hypothetical protein
MCVMLKHNLRADRQVRRVWPAGLARQAAKGADSLDGCGLPGRCDDCDPSRGGQGTSDSPTGVILAFPFCGAAFAYAWNIRRSPEPGVGWDKAALAARRHGTNHSLYS